MSKFIFTLIFIFTSTISFSEDLFTQDYIKKVEQLRDFAKTDNTAYNLAESLTTEVGHRLGGSPNDIKGVNWAVNKFEELGFDKVYTEPVTFKRWIRGLEQAEVVSPFPQPLKITALGRSFPTPDEGITAEIVHFQTFEDLEKAEDSKVKDKIVFISNRMERHKDGSGYGKANTARYKSAYVTGQKGGVGTIIRSIGTDYHSRNPHTGAMMASITDELTGEIHNLTEHELVPAGAISNPDADLLVNMLKRNKPIKIKMTLLSHWGEEYTSQNVIGEITGREKPEEVVVIGGHLDSWDLGTGAIDDASGCAITMATAKLIKDAGIKPYRTIRVVLWANEEYGLDGAKAYAQAHENDMQNHIIAAESDFGAAPIYALSSGVSVDSLAVVKIMAKLLEPLGIIYEGNTGKYGPDIIPLKKNGIATMGLRQDGTNYFDLHHTADDTFDKIAPEEMAQNVAAWIVFVSLAAEYKGNFGYNHK
jgi:hypothetical protein